MNVKMIEDNMNKTSKYDPNRKLLPQEVREHFLIVMLETFGGGPRKVIYVQDYWKYNTLDQVNEDLSKYLDKLKIDLEKYEISYHNVAYKEDFIGSGLTDKQINEICKKYNIPNEPPK